MALLRHGAAEGWWFRAKEEIVKSLVRSSLRPDSVVCLLGLGSGGTIRRLRQLAPDCTISGLDLDPESVAHCEAIDPPGIYRVADLETDSIAAQNSLDLVVALDILEHLEQDGGVTARVKSTLKPGGMFAVNVPAHPWLFSDHDRHLGHRRRYRPREIRTLMEHQGLEIVHDTPLFSSALILVAVWRRLILPLFGGMDHSDVVLSFPRPIDSLLYLVARLEGVAARYGLPFGSSHFVLARKP